MTGNVLAVIPARGSNDEVEHMNICELGGHPLIHYTIKAALDSKYINRIVVSTEDERVAKIASDAGAEIPFLRPEYLCNGDTSLIDVVKYNIETLESLEDYNCDVIVVLLPNTPFKSSEDIDNMIKYLEEEKLDSVIPVNKTNGFFWKMEKGEILPVNFEYRTKRDDTDILYEEKGGIYIYKRDSLDISQNMDLKLKLGHKKRHYELNKHRAQTIHSMYDFFVFERLIRLPESLISAMMDHM